MSEEFIRPFDEWETLNGIFSGNPRQNLPYAGERLGVSLVARDTWIKVVADNRGALERALAFLDKLVEIKRGMADGVIPQREFEQVVNAFGNHREDDLKTFFQERIKVSKAKNDIIPKNRAQLEYLRQIRGREIVFGVGAAGTGKTYLAMAAAVAELLEGKRGRIVLTRPAREAGEALGFLPGNLEEKILPYLRPLYDALYDMMEPREAAALMQDNVIEIAPLAFMRGRSLNNAFVILDEAQNTTVEQMLMFLTRLGFNSHCVITGDPSQTDLPRSETSGLAHAIAALKSVEEIAFCHFTARDSVRHFLIEKIIQAYQNAERTA